MITKDFIQNNKDLNDSIDIPDQFEKSNNALANRSTNKQRENELFKMEDAITNKIKSLKREGKNSAADSLKKSFENTQKEIWENKDTNFPTIVEEVKKDGKIVDAGKVLKEKQTLAKMDNVDAFKSKITQQKPANQGVSTTSQAPSTQQQQGQQQPIIPPPPSTQQTTQPKEQGQQHTSVNNTKAILTKAPSANQAAQTSKNINEVKQNANAISKTNNNIKTNNANLPAYNTQNKSNNQEAGVSR